MTFNYALKINTVLKCKKYHCDLEKKTTAMFKVQTNESKLHDSEMVWSLRSVHTILTHLQLAGKAECRRLLPLKWH